MGERDLSQTLTVFVTYIVSLNNPADSLGDLLVEAGIHPFSPSLVLPSPIHFPFSAIPSLPSHIPFPPLPLPLPFPCQSVPSPSLLFPTHSPARGSGEHCKLPQRGSRRSPSVNAYLTILTPECTSGGDRFRSLLMLVVTIYLLKVHNDRKMPY